jgi:hypothetical protein
VKTEVRGNTLTIYRDKGFSFSEMLRSKTVKVYITTPQLSGIEVSGASDVKGETPISADDFRINASGASDVTLTLNAKSLTTNASGASDVRLDGRVERQQVDISGSSDYRASDLHSRKADVQASGASDAYVFVDDELLAHSSGASDVHPLNFGAPLFKSRKCQSTGCLSAFSFPLQEASHLADHTDCKILIFDSLLYSLTIREPTS